MKVASCTNEGNFMHSVAPLWHLPKKYVFRNFLKCSKFENKLPVDSKILTICIIMIGTKGMAI